MYFDVYSGLLISFSLTMYSWMNGSFRGQWSTFSIANAVCLGVSEHVEHGLSHSKHIMFQVRAANISQITATYSFSRLFLIFTMTTGLDAPRHKYSWIFYKLYKLYTCTDIDIEWCKVFCSHSTSTGHLLSWPHYEPIHRKTAPGLGTSKGRSRRVIFYKLPADSGRKDKVSCFLRFFFEMRWWPTGWTCIH